MPEPHRKTTKIRQREYRPRLGLPLCMPGKPTCELADGVAVVLAAGVIQDLFGYAYATDTEISCLGTVRRRGSVFRVEQLYLLRQVSSLAHTELDQTAVAELMEQLMAEGKAEEAKSLKCWVHSHPGGMGVFWSHTDEATCRLLVSDFLISIVIGEGYRAKCRLDVAMPVPFAADDVPVYYEMAQESGKDYAAEVKEKVHVDRCSSYILLDVPSGRDKGGGAPCPYCGEWHEPECCPFLEETALFYGDWDYGRF